MVTNSPHSILEWKPESKSALEYYQSVPWCAQIISDPRIRPYRADYPNRPSPVGSDPFLHGILSREGGLSRYLSFMAEAGVFPALDLDTERDPVARGREATSGTLDKTNTKTQFPLPSRPILSASPTPDLPSPFPGLPENPYPIHLDFYTFGPATHGIPNTIHGGALTAILDGVLGKVAFLHRSPKAQIYSAYTNVRFLKPLVTDATGSVTVLFKSQISYRLSKGKNIIALGTVESSTGKVYATAESMLVETQWKTRL
jgi:acyl-coenzyme A thioesterase PaaI-like protein